VRECKHSSGRDYRVTRPRAGPKQAQQKEVLQQELLDAREDDVSNKALDEQSRGRWCVQRAEPPRANDCHSGNRRCSQNDPGCA
jgi:hypothetical protein